MQIFYPGISITLPRLEDALTLSDCNHASFSRGGVNGAEANAV